MVWCATGSRTRTVAAQQRLVLPMGTGGCLSRTPETGLTRRSVVERRTHWWGRKERFCCRTLCDHHPWRGGGGRQLEICNGKANCCLIHAVQNQTTCQISIVQVTCEVEGTVCVIMTSTHTHGQQVQIQGKIIHVFVQEGGKGQEGGSSWGGHAACRAPREVGPLQAFQLA